MDTSSELRRRVLARWPMCVAGCGSRATNTHHVLGKGSPYFGDDVDDNLVSLCGSGAVGCHGALHGCPWKAPDGRRWTGEDVRRAIGRHLDSRPETSAYVLGKLGEVAGLDYLRRHYHVDSAA